MYAVITLQDSKDLKVIPTKWLNEQKTQCCMPAFMSQEKLMEAVKNSLERSTGGNPWGMFDIQVHSECETFEQAEEKQKVIRKQNERPAAGISGIHKRQKLENSQIMSKYPFQLPNAFSSGDKERLFQMLGEIKSSVLENTGMLRKLIKDNQVSEAPSSTSMPSRDTMSNLNLPLKTFADVIKAEFELGDPKTHQKYVQYLSMHFSPKDVVKNIMQRVLTDDLAKEFNWTGRGGKKCFSEFKLAEVIKEASSKYVNMEDCETEIKKYLSHTADRLSRKRPRDFGILFPEVICDFSHIA
ncbi:uncharacterized protein LOC127425633 [Myxocyprinus asiaticus]|uniref:uncharacterized protein LOC127425633 n=1 Tax=Myxocyprinus asiaticus TaxID=70543 RepID=UPI002223A965|nr:uncharacterized protein LOC127425633 [Myxocyprinus asiaticus]XP_051527783.1 uncharacterized protein LOC127425633 [Myxocyprinus asiaticus]XP_051527784.1 uncharacterized protein LOC127425633 [Myxocyprinus asiaticus]